MTEIKRSLLSFSAIFLIISCAEKKNPSQTELNTLALNHGEIALCSSGNNQFGTITFNLSCSEKARLDFNLATALLHSFEYSEAEKLYAKVIDQDPDCILAYWGAAMCSFHPLWERPSQSDLQKGSKIITLARSIITDKSSRESDYIEAIASIYDDWDKLDHHTRVLKFEKASEKVFKKYPDDNEAAIFYALALRASSDPKDKTFYNQRKAGEILTKIFEKEPNHPGIAHYIIHTFDYPELASQALSAARKYAIIASASAHAQHMPSHIFTRLGLWDESIQSNLNSISAAQCYAENLGMKDHWDEELHGMDYLIYAYLQKGDDEKAKEQIEYLKTIKNVFPQNFKVAYSFASIPCRYAVERKDWNQAATIDLTERDIQWDKFPWEKSNANFSRLLGAIHLKRLDNAKNELKQLQDNYDKLNEDKESYKANLVKIQIEISEGWIKFLEGKKEEAISLLKEAADMEEATEKHPVTPGEIIPARESLADLYIELSEPSKALDAYEADLKRHPDRFNGLYGAGLAAKQIDNKEKAKMYFNRLLTITNPKCSRPEIQIARSFVSGNDL